MIVQPMIISLSCHRWKRKEMALRHALIFPTHDWWHCQVSRAAWPCHPATQSQWSWLYGSVLCRGRPGCSGLQVKQSRVAKFRPGPWMHGISSAPFCLWCGYRSRLKKYIYICNMLHQCESGTMYWVVHSGAKTVAAVSLLSLFSLFFLTQY